MYERNHFRSILFFVLTLGSYVKCSEMYECKSPDFNADYNVNLLDFALFADNWLIDSSGYNFNAIYDLNCDERVDSNDLMLFLWRWLEAYQEPNDTFDLFKSALTVRDINAAMGYVAENSKEKYTEIFQAMGDNMPDFAAGMGTLTLQSQDENTAVYEMIYQDGPNTYSFPVIFIKDNDGNWRIYNF